MAVTVQANLVQLKVADARRRGIAPAAHEIDVPSPGGITRFREALIDHRALGRYGEEHVKLRFREVWGQYCVMRWAFFLDHEPGSIDFSNLPNTPDLRDGSVIRTKVREIHAIFWKIAFEQARRRDKAAEDAPVYKNDREAFDRIPARVGGHPVAECNDDEILAAACEHAGMLACARWLADERVAWASPGIMELGPGPFEHAYEPLPGENQS